MSDFFNAGSDEARAPECENLPDGRKRLTRFFDVAHRSTIGARLAPDYGALHAGNAPTGWENLRLIDAKVTDQVSGAKTKDTRPLLIQIYETLPETAEIQVGANTRIKLEDGREAIEAEFLQLVAGAYVPGTVGTTTAPGDASAFLQRAEQTDDGALRRIKRTYVYAGIIATDEQVKEGGALTIKTITSVKTVPTTPAGYTLIGKPTQNPNGLPVYTYAYALGSGLVFTQANDALDGRITYTTKRAYGAPSAATGEFETTTEEADGYTVYVSRGIVINSADLPDEVTNRFGGMLVITRKRKINAAPTGSGTLLLDTADPAEGYTLYTRAWAAGAGGLVSTETRDHLDGRITYTTKRAYAAASAATNEFESSEEEDADGYTVYISRGIVINSADLPDEVTNRFGGKLTITRKRKINAAPTGSGTLLLDTADPAEGYTLYTRAWAAGAGGLVSTETRDHLDGRITYTTKRAYANASAATNEFETSTETDADGYTVYVSRGIVINSAAFPDEVTHRFGGKLTITRKRKIDAAPTGSGTLILDTADPAEGYTLYTSAWADGAGGLVSTETRDHLDGRITYTTKRAYANASAATNEFETSEETDADGYTVYVSRGIVINSADLPDEVTNRFGGKLTITRKRKINAAPTGSGTLILDTADPADGYTLYTCAWADGAGGLVSTETRDHLDGRITYTTKRAYANASAATNEFETSEETDADGYTVYVSRGIVINSADLPDEVTKRNMGKLTITRKRKINAAPTGDGTEIFSSDDPGDGYTLYTRAFVNGSGLVSETKKDGPLPGTTLVTRRSYGEADLPTGVLIASEDEDDDGYIVHTRTVFQGTPTGHSYEDIVSVNVPGTVDLNTVDVEAGDVAVAYVTPPRTKEVLATVTVSYTTAPSGGGAPAYDIGDISCSVTFVKTDRIYAGTQGKGTGSELDVYRVNSTVQIAEYRGCYLLTPSAEGSQSWEDVGADSETYTSTSETQAIGTGATSGTISTSGLIRRTCRPVLTALNGVTYYEVTEWNA